MKTELTKNYLQLAPKSFCSKQTRVAGLKVTTHQFHRMIKLTDELTIQVKSFRFKNEDSAMSLFFWLGNRFCLGLIHLVRTQNFPSNH